MHGKAVFWGIVSYEKLSPQLIGRSNGIAHFREKSKEIFIFLCIFKLGRSVLMKKASVKVR